jgi:hypothetical protein
MNTNNCNIKPNVPKSKHKFLSSIIDFFRQTRNKFIAAKIAAFSNPASFVNKKKFPDL